MSQYPVKILHSTVYSPHIQRTYTVIGAVCGTETHELLYVNTHDFNTYWSENCLKCIDRLAHSAPTFKEKHKSHTKALTGT